MRYKTVDPDMEYW